MSAFTTRDDFRWRHDVAVMEETGISMQGCKPKQLTQQMVNSADKIITMGCGVDATACPARFLVTEDWGLDDPAGQPIETMLLLRDRPDYAVGLII